MVLGALLAFPVSAPPADKVVAQYLDVALDRING